MDDGVTIQPYRKAFAWGGMWLAVLTVSFSLAYAHFSAEGFGRFFGLTMLSALMTGFIAKRAKSPWSFVKIGLIYFAVAMALFLVSSIPAVQRS
jgi:hypothetical protein